MVFGLVIDKPISHFNLAPHYRGGERQTELLICELAKRGYSQRLIIKRGNSLASRCANITRLEICEVASNHISAALAAKGSRVTHAHDGRTVYCGLLAQVFFGIPYVITRRVVAPQSINMLRTLAYERAAAVAAVSKAAAEELGKRHRDLVPVIVPDANAGFCANENKVEAIRSRYSGKVLIGHVGALDHSHKGQSTIIEAARIAAQEYPNWHFILCGEGKHEARFRDEIGDLANIEMTGWVESVGDYLASFDIFVYPSLHEALGSTLLDAMQFKLPIVASSVGGIPEFIEDKVNGRLVGPEKPQELVDALVELLADVNELSAIGTRNGIKAKSFDVSHMTDAYLAMYETL